uniref:Uncharacterized protein n=1 Tax=Ananas comosus var. bracteatus TaxID=296719 RepID=A0A6V7PXK1_ANACO|nr:unnamed protein product [Ananas comosus var. bracteatus]
MQAGAGRSPSDPGRMGSAAQQQQQVPVVVALNCLEEVSLEQEGLSGVAAVEHVPLSRLSDGRLDSASAVLLHSLAFLPRAAQRRLRPWQLLLCLGSPDRAADSALAADLGLRLAHVDANRAEEVADTVMALLLGLLRRTHLLSRHSSSSSSASASPPGSAPSSPSAAACAAAAASSSASSAAPPPPAASPPAASPSA